MARIVDLSRYWVLAAAAVKAGQAERLRSGVGVQGQALARRQKEQTRTGPLGGNIPERIQRASVATSPLGFAISYDDVTERFNGGDPGPARTILGIPASQRSSLLRGAGREVARQLQAALRRAG